MERVATSRKTGPNHHVGSIILVHKKINSQQPIFFIERDVINVVRKTDTLLRPFIHIYLT